MGYRSAFYIGMYFPRYNLSDVSSGDQNLAHEKKKREAKTKKSFFSEYRFEGL